MPSIDINFLKSLKCDLDSYKYFIETGTFHGETIFHCERYFEKLYTIELSSHFYNTARLKYNGDKINFILGDSSLVFKELLPTIDKNSIFFLDGHYSQCGTAQGNKDCPLNEEVQEIYNLMKHKCVIIIDDYRLFGKKLSEDWSDINKDHILQILGDRVELVYHLPSYLSADDRLIIHLKEKN